MTWLDALANFSTNQNAWVQFATKTGGVGAYNPMTRKKLYGADALAVLNAKQRHPKPEDHGLQHGAGEDDVDAHSRAVTPTGDEMPRYKKEWGSPNDWKEDKDAWGNVIVRHKDGKQVLKRGAAQAVLAEQKRHEAKSEGKPEPPQTGRWKEGKDAWGNVTATNERGVVFKHAKARALLDEQAKRDAAEKKEPEKPFPSKPEEKKPSAPEAPKTGEQEREAKMLAYVDSIQDPTERVAMRRVVQNTAGDDTALFWKPFIPKDAETLARFQPHIDKLQGIMDEHHAAEKEAKANSPEEKTKQDTKLKLTDLAAKHGKAEGELRERHAREQADLEDQGRSGDYETSQRHNRERQALEDQHAAERRSILDKHPPGEERMALSTHYNEVKNSHWHEHDKRIKELKRERERGRLEKLHTDEWQKLDKAATWAQKNQVRRRQADELAKLLAKHQRERDGKPQTMSVWLGGGQTATFGQGEGPEWKQPMKTPDPIPPPEQPPERVTDAARLTRGIDHDHYVEAFEKLKSAPFSHWHPDDQAAFRKLKDFVKSEGTSTKKFTPEQKMTLAHLALYEAHSQFEEWGIENNLSEFDDLGGDDLTKSQQQRQLRNRVDMVRLGDDLMEVVGKYAQKGVKPTHRLIVLSAGEFKRSGGTFLAYYQGDARGQHGAGIVIRYPPGGYDEMNKLKDTSMQSGWTVEGDGFKTTVHHEIGHALHDQAGRLTPFHGTHPYRSFGWSDETKFTKELAADKDLELTQEHLSRYASKHPLEFVAETHAALSFGRKLPAAIMERFHALGGVAPPWAEDPVDHSLPSTQELREKAAVRRFEALDKQLIEALDTAKQHPLDSYWTRLKNDILKARAHEEEKYRADFGKDAPDEHVKQQWRDIIEKKRRHWEDVDLPDMMKQVKKGKYDQQYVEDTKKEREGAHARRMQVFKERWGDEYDPSAPKAQVEPEPVDPSVVEAARELRGTTGLTDDQESGERFHKWLNNVNGGASMVVRANVLKAHVDGRHGQLNLSPGALGALVRGIGDDDAGSIARHAVEHLNVKDGVAQNSNAVAVLLAIRNHSGEYRARALVPDDWTDVHAHKPHEHWLNPEHSENPRVKHKLGGTLAYVQDTKNAPFRKGFLQEWGRGSSLGTHLAHEVGRSVGMMESGIGLDDHDPRYHGVPQRLNALPDGHYDAAASVYHETQKHYADQGVTHKRLFLLPHPKGYDSKHALPMERWTDNYREAVRHWGHEHPPVRNVPVQHIYASHETHREELSSKGAPAHGLYAVMYGLHVPPPSEDPEAVRSERREKNYPTLQEHIQQHLGHAGEKTDALKGKTIKDQDTGRKGVVVGGSAHPDVGLIMPKVHWEGDHEPSHLELRKDSIGSDADRYVITHQREELGHPTRSGRSQFQMYQEKLRRDAGAREPAGNADRRSVEQRVMVGDLIVVIENRAGSVRSGTDKNGRVWQTTMQHAYGRISGYVGADGEAVDVFVGPDTTSRNVFIVNQVRQEDPSQFDEHKVMLGFRTRDEAVQAYLSNYEQGWKCGPVKQTSMEQFKNWLRTGDTTIAVNRKEEKTVTTNAKKPGLFASLKRLFGRNDSTTDAPKAPPAAAPLLAGFTGFADRMGLARGTSAYDAVLADYVRGMVLDTRTQLWGGAPGAPVDAPPIPAPWDFPRAEWVRIVTERAAGLQQGVDLTRLWDEAVALRS